MVLFCGLSASSVWSPVTHSFLRPLRPQGRGREGSWGHACLRIRPGQGLASPLLSWRRGSRHSHKAAQRSLPLGPLWGKTEKGGRASPVSRTSPPRRLEERLPQSDCPQLGVDAWPRPRAPTRSLQTARGPDQTELRLLKDTSQDGSPSPSGGSGWSPPPPLRLPGPSPVPGYMRSAAS